MTEEAKGKKTSKLSNPHYVYRKHTISGGVEKSSKHLEKYEGTATKLHFVWCNQFLRRKEKKSDIDVTLT